MNQNDLDRYYWRTGQRWCGDGRRPDARWRPRKTSTRAILFLFAALAVLAAMRLTLR